MAPGRCRSRRRQLEQARFQLQRDRHSRRFRQLQPAHRRQPAKLSGRARKLAAGNPAAIRVERQLQGALVSAVVVIWLCGLPLEAWVIPMIAPTATMAPITNSAVVLSPCAFCTPAGLPGAKAPAPPAARADEAIRLNDRAAATKLRMRPPRISFLERMPARQSA